MKLSLGFSPCPNDTFIFDALIHHKIDTEGLEFDVFFDDVESLNHKAFKGEPDVCKLSFFAFAHITRLYTLLNAGSALGSGVGPLLICKDPKLVQEHTNFSNLTVGIPGRYTTAHFLLGLAFPQLTQKKILNFSSIEEQLLKEEIDLGLIIHENRFTYLEKGLHKIIDLGDFWEKETGAPIPLGGIAVKKELDQEIKQTLDRVLRKSVEYAFKNPHSGIEFIRSHAQEMDEEVMYKHIQLYVNDFSINLGTNGRRAIEDLFTRAARLKLIPEIHQPIFLDA